MESAFLPLLNDTVTFYTRELDGYGDPTFVQGGDAVARVEWKQRIIFQSTGEEKLADGTIYMGLTPQVLTGWDVLLPGGTRATVEVVQRLRDERGDHHQEVVFSL